MNRILNKPKAQGFTIVELLIVVVVIAILAAITIVSYNGITAKANASAAKSTASSVQKKIELYQAQEGRYPIAKSELTTANKSYTLDTALFGRWWPTPNDAVTKGTGYVQVYTCSNGTLSTTTVTGSRIDWWDYEKTSNQKTSIAAGDCTGKELTNIPD